MGDKEDIEENSDPKPDAVKGNKEKTDNDHGEETENSIELVDEKTKEDQDHHKIAEKKEGEPEADPVMEGEKDAPDGDSVNDDVNDETLDDAATDDNDPDSLEKADGDLKADAVKEKEDDVDGDAVNKDSVEDTGSKKEPITEEKKNIPEPEAVKEDEKKKD